MLTGRKSLVGLFAIGMLVAGGISPAIAKHIRSHQLGEVFIDTDEIPFITEQLLGTTTCPAFDHHEIDAASLLLNIDIADVGHIADVNPLSVSNVEDDGVIPSIFCSLFTPGNLIKQIDPASLIFRVTPPAGFNFDREAEIKATINTADTFTTIKRSVKIHSISEPEAAACRNQILQSRSWQRYCAPALELR